MDVPLTTFNEVRGDLRTKIQQNPEGWRRVQETNIDLEANEGFSNSGYTSIHIPENVESAFGSTTQLLGGAGAAATGTLAGTGLGSSAALLPGAVLIGAGVAAGIGGLVSTHYPGHEYLGPGTDLEKASSPVDTDDNIARAHDIAYTKVKTAEDIQQADSEAIGAFEDDFAATGNLHSKIGSTLLGVKQAVETYTGPLYPQVNHG